MYFTGEGVPVNKSKAMGWFYKAGKGGHLRAREAYRDLEIEGYSPDLKE
jgi:TPR repeat protein